MVVKIGPIASSIFLSFNIQEQRLEELHKEQKLEEHGPESCDTLDGSVSESKTKASSTSL
jgi:hypothetical protein